MSFFNKLFGQKKEQDPYKIEETLKLLVQGPNRQSALKLVGLLYTLAQSDPSIADLITGKLSDMVKHGSNLEIQDRALFALHFMSEENLAAAKRELSLLNTEGHVSRILQAKGLID